MQFHCSRILPQQDTRYGLEFSHARSLNYGKHEIQKTNFMCFSKVRLGITRGSYVTGYIKRIRIMRPVESDRISASAKVFYLFFCPDLIFADFKPIISKLSRLVWEQQRRFFRRFPSSDGRTCIGCFRIPDRLGDE